MSLLARVSRFWRSCRGIATSFSATDLRATSAPSWWSTARSSDWARSTQGHTYTLTLQRYSLIHTVIIASIHVFLGTASIQVLQLTGLRDRGTFVCLFVCFMYVCMYVVNMCTLYDITNVWNELGCLLRLQPPLPLRQWHQHPDLPWWVLHSFVWWLCMLVTYILVCKCDLSRCMFSFWNICKQLSYWSAGEDANRCEVERPQCRK